MKATGQTVLWKHRGFCKGVSAGHRGIQEVPLIEKVRQPSAGAEISPRGPLHKPYWVVRLFFLPWSPGTQLTPTPCHVFLSPSLTIERDQSPSLAALQRDKTTGPCRCKYYLFKTQQASMWEQSGSSLRRDLSQICPREPTGM